MGESIEIYDLPDNLENMTLDHNKKANDLIEFV